VKNKKMVLSLAAVLSICLIGLFFFKNVFLTQTGSEYRNITDMKSSYEADAEIASALAQLKNSQEKATIITGGKSGQRQIALTFDGLSDRTTMQQVLDLLKKYNAKATFFVDGMQTAEDPQTVVNIKNAGYRIENYTLSGMGKMDTLPVERLVRDFCRAQKIIRVTTDQGPNLLKCNDTKYTDQVLQAAKAAGFVSVVRSDAFVNVKQVNSPQAADAFVGSLQPGNIVSVKLKTNTEPVAKDAGKTEQKPAIDKQPGLKNLTQQADFGEKGTIEAVEKLLIALAKANYTTVYVEDFAVKSQTKPVKTSLLPDSSLLVQQITAFWTVASSLIQEEATNFLAIRKAYAADTASAAAQEIKVIPTTEPALSFTFGGISNEAVVNDMLTRLQNLGIKGTFFIADTEMKKYPGTLRTIINNGHELGIAIRPKDGETLEETQRLILRDRKLLQEQFGVDTYLVKQPWGAVADTTKAAVAGIGCKLIGQSINVVQSKHKDYSTADQVMAEIFGKSVISLGRGQIIHFRMDFYSNDRLIGDLVAAIKQRKVDNIAFATSYDNPASNQANSSQYVIKPVGAILGNAKYVYQYPVDPATIPAYLRSNAPKLVINDHNFLTEVSKRYIGNPDVGYEDRMLGFSRMDTRRLDKTGLVHTNDNVIFLTFDDWGTDAPINKLLYVLRKHKVPGVFFILTHNVMYNPNLLRAIAVEGHEIGSHSDMHKPMVVRDPKTGKQVPTQTKDEYTAELASSYQKLEQIVGNVTVNGKPALTRFFRPPTLAVSRMGFEALLATGYEYTISGESTYDYKAENVSQLVNTIKDYIYTKNGEVKKGTVLVLHMGDGVPYTPIALDILLTANEAKADSDPSKFKVGRLSDYLKTGYTQMSQHLQ